MPDRNGDEEDGMDEILIPGDFREAGQIVDDEIYSEFVTQVPAGVHVVCMIDCCHSGTAMDLPYVCSVGDEEMRASDGFKPMPITGAALTPKQKSSKKDKNSKKDAKAKKDKKKSSGDKKPSAAKDTKDKKKKGPKKKVAAAKDEEPQEYYEEEMELHPADDEDGSGEASYEEVERPESSKKEKKKGLFGFGRKNKSKA